VSEAVAQLLGRAEFSHFCHASSRGGVAVPNTRPSATSAASERSSATLGEAIVERWKESQGHLRAETPVGLRRRSK
jgi:hypothetical protein